MTEINEATPRGEYTIAGEVLQIPAPYHEGHKLTVGEASQLNQVYAENIRNNLAKKVTDLKEAGTFDVEAFQKELDEYCDDYEMGVRTGGGGRTSDPVLQKAMEIARDHVRAAIKKAGIQLSQVTSAQITAKAKKVLEKNPQITDLARKQVEETKAIAGLVLDSLQSDGVVEPEGDAPKGRKAKAHAPEPA